MGRKESNQINKQTLCLGSIGLDSGVVTLVIKGQFFKIFHGLFFRLSHQLLKQKMLRQLFEILGKNILC